MTLALKRVKRWEKERKGYQREGTETEDKTDSIENIGFTGAVETGNSIELSIKARDDSSGSVGLKAVDDDFLDVH